MIKIGSSIDIHRFGSNKALKLGGIEINHNEGLIGHSDADVLLHAISEALIGAMGHGDLGDWFSDQDEQYKDIDSSILLREVLNVMEEESYKIGNIDTLIICEKPYLKDFKSSIKENVAKICKISNKQINIKATRPEKLGDLGQGKGILVLVTLLIEKEKENE